MRLLWNLFVVFTRVSLSSWGAGPASLALMQRETVAAGWTSPAEFADAVAVGNALPGPISPQVSAFVGYKVAGFSGAVVAATGTVVPATLLMLAMIVFFFSVKDSKVVASMLAAVRPVVVGLLLWTAFDMGRTVFGASSLRGVHALAHAWDKLLFAAAAFAVLTFTRLNPAFLILGAAVLGVVVYLH
ncbi:MAG TPA: chromate transporter [Polyangia bacterium]